MPYKVLTNRFAEWSYGDIVDMDDDAARVPLENGELEPVKKTIKKPVKKAVKKIVKKPLKKKK